MEQLSCEWCGQKASSEYPVWGHKETVNSPYVVSHQTHGYCIMAALARAEAAEAEAARLRDENAEAWHAFDRQQDRGNRLATRVAELEAQLTAQGWRPVTITEPSQNVMAELLIVGYRGDDGYWHYPDGPDGLVIRGWRPIPTVPQETE